MTICDTLFVLPSLIASILLLSNDKFTIVKYKWFCAMHAIIKLIGNLSL